MPAPVGAIHAHPVQGPGVDAGEVGGRVVLPPAVAVAVAEDVATDVSVKLVAVAVGAHVGAGVFLVEDHFDAHGLDLLHGPAEILPCAETRIGIVDGKAPVLSGKGPPDELDGTDAVARAFLSALDEVLV